MRPEIVAVDHFGIAWKRFKLPNLPPRYASNIWRVEHDVVKNVWVLWKDNENAFYSDIPLLVFMVAREMILEHAADSIVSTWWKYGY